MATVTLTFTPPGTPPANGYLVKYRKVGDVSYTTLTPNQTTSPITITGLPDGFEWEGTIESDCDGMGNHSPVVNWGFPPMTVTLSKSGSFSGTLTPSVTGGIGPYTYLFTCTASGPCTDYTIDTPTGTTSTYVCTAYAGADYYFYVHVTDSVGHTVTSPIGSSSTCLIPETSILFADNTEKLLSDVKIGDILLDINTDQLENTTTEVTGVQIFTTSTIFDINDGLLKCSAGHIHIVANRNYEQVQTIDLKLGDLLLNKNKEFVEIKTIEKLEGQFDVINLSTSTKQFIANGILTHNKTACP